MYIVNASLLHLDCIKFDVAKLPQNHTCKCIEISVCCSYCTITMDFSISYMLIFLNERKIQNISVVADFCRSMTNSAHALDISSVKNHSSASWTD